MRLKHKFVHTDTHAWGKKYIQETHTCYAHTCRKHTHTHTAELQRQRTNMKPRAVFQFLSLSLVSTQLPPFFFEQQFFFIFFSIEALTIPFMQEHANLLVSPEPYHFTLKMKWYRWLFSLWHLHRLNPTCLQQLVAPGGGKGCKCFHNMRAAGVSHMRQCAGINWPPCKHPGGL